MVIIVAFGLLITVLSFSSLKQVPRVLGFALLLFIVYLYAWVLFPFSPERWKDSSLFKKRLLARNFINFHDYVGKSKDEIEALFGPGRNQDVWSYFADKPSESPSLDGLSISFSDGRVTEVTSMWAGEIPPVDAIFEPEKWRHSNRQERAKYLGDIIAQQILLRKTKTELTILLGEPDRQSFISYDLGLPFGEIDGYTLDFMYDQNGKILSGDIYQH